MPGELIVFKKFANRNPADKGNAEKGKTSASAERKPKSAAERIAAKETNFREAVRAWTHDLASKVIQAMRADVALRFHDKPDDEEGASDLQGEYDPIVNNKTATRLSDVIAENAVEIKRPERMLKRLLDSQLKKQWTELRKQNIKISDPDGKRYGNYLTNVHGVWTKVRVGEIHDLYVWRRIARTQIDPVALSYDPGRRNWKRHYRITNETGELEVQIGAEKLAKKADRAIGILMRCGVHVVETDEARQHLAKFLRFKPLARFIRAARTGWFRAPNGWAFVLPDETLGDVKGAKVNVATVVLDQAEAHGLRESFGFQRSGTIEQWCQKVAQPLAGNSNVILAIGTMFAAPLLRWAGEAGGGFHSYGHSKIGKTLIGAAGQSVWGKPYFPGAGADAFGYSWEATTNRFGERARLRSDIGLYLDEIGLCDPKTVATTVYKLAGGLDRGRFRQAESDFNVLFLSTGELSLDEFVPNAREGQRVRMVDIPAVVRSEGGSESAFETISGSEIVAAAKRFYAATAECHGQVGYEWLCHLTALGPRRIQAELKQVRETWRALPQVAGTENRANQQVVSVINRFALAAAALHMAATAKLIPWAAADIDAGIIRCMTRWVNQRGNVDLAGEMLRQIKQRRQFLAETIKEDRLDGHIKSGRILVRPEAWHRLWSGLDEDAVKKHLLDVALLIPGRNGKVPSVAKIGRASQRFYVLAWAFVEPFINST
jgi:Domain of unknown function (DUF927)